MNRIKAKAKTRLQPSSCSHMFESHLSKICMLCYFGLYSLILFFIRYLLKIIIKTKNRTELAYRYLNLGITWSIYLIPRYKVGTCG